MPCLNELRSFHGCVAAVCLFVTGAGVSGTTSVPTTGTVVEPLEVAKRLGATTYKDAAYPGTTWFMALDKAKRPQTVDCTGFLSAVMRECFEEAGKEYADAVRKRVMIADFTEEELKQPTLNSIVEKGEDKRLQGVTRAVIDAGVGKSVEGIGSAKPGDLMQYWYKTGDNWDGHCGVIQSINGTRATLFGSHRSALASEKALPVDQRHGGVGESVFIEFGPKGGKRVFLARFTAEKKGQ